MATISRVKTIFTGFAGAPGVCTMYFRDTLTAVDSVHQFWDTIRGIVPDDVTAQVDNVGDVIEDSTGALLGNWISAPVLPIVGGQTGAYAAPAGGAIRWQTGVILNGSRVSGRTFVVPLAASSFDLNGSLTPVAIAYMTDAAAALVLQQSSSFCIWHRPFAGSPAVGTRPARPPFIGSNALVVGGRVLDRVAVLRSRQA